MNERFLTKLHGLRGIAILWVLLFHFFPEVFPGGYMGVDIFFALSGFLVSKSIFEKNLLQRSGKFLHYFYTARIARILPLVVFCSIISLLAYALFLETEHDLHRAISFYASSIIGFTNLYLYKSSSDYFALDQEFNFFTQTWSLGIEEQFYLLFSLLVAISILFASKLKRIEAAKILYFLLLVTTLSSLCFSIIHSLLGGREQFLFYMIPSRWWELSIGVLVSYVIFIKRFNVGRFESFKLNHLENLAVFLILICLFLGYRAEYFPMPIAIIPVLATVMLLFLSTLDTRSVSSLILKNPILQWLGTISFSLYLVHWIVLVFQRYTFGSETFYSRTIGILVSIAISYATYRLIEKPSQLLFRKRAALAYVFLFLVLSTTSATYVYSIYRPIQFNPLYLGHHLNVDIQRWGDERSCHGRRKMANLDDPFASCLAVVRSTDKDRVLFIHGDSHAVQLTFMAESALELSRYQTRYINTESFDDIYGFTRTRWKAGKNPAVMDYILEKSVAGDLVLLTFADYRLNRSRITSTLIDQGFDIHDNYIKKLNDRGVKVILVGDTPTFRKAPISECLIKFSFFGNRASCAITRTEAELTRQRQVEMFLELVNQNSNAFYWDLFPHFCDEDTCFMVDEKDLLFVDHHHISKKASISLAPKFLKYLEEIQVQVF